MTSLRIVCSLCIIFSKVFSESFFVLYIAAGITDIIDGFIARKFNAESSFGERYDSVADVLFIGICLFKIVPVLYLKIWHIVWIIMIAIIKGCNLLFSYLYHRKKGFLHTTTNRITGLLLFLFPVFFMCVQKDDLIAVLCVVATFAAIQEGHYIACCYYVYKENDNNGSN